jgi:hypothetical protein
LSTAGPATHRRFLVDECENIVDLAPYDLQTAPAITVKLDPQDSGGNTLVAWADYILKPQPSRLGVYTRIKLQEPLPVTANWRRGTERLVEVTGTWGFPEVPSDVQHWTNVVVATWLRKDVAAFSNVFKLDEGQVERASMLPGGAMAGLAHYSRDI